MSVWSEFRSTVGLPVGRTPWGALCRFIDEGRVELVVIKGQAVEGDFFEPQKIAGHQTKLFRATAPTNDPSFWPLLHEKKVRVQVIAVGPGLLTRLALGSVPLALFLGFGLWVSRRGKQENA